jgi:hypothetical protein
LSVCFLFSCLLRNEAISASAKDGTSGFIAEASVSVEVHQQEHAPSPVLKTGGTVLFASSNGWWQIRYHREWVEAGNAALRRGGGTFIDCKRVPDGIRWFVTTEQRNPADKGHPLAFVQPIAYPPPEEAELFLSWLSLCPYPELPIVDTNIMRKFVASKWINQPQNLGSCVVSYLQPDNAFLSRLDVLNTNGIIFAADGRPQQLDAPFNQGFTELKYDVGEVTNFGGRLFPKRTVLSKYMPRTSAKSRDDVYAVLVCRLEVQRLENWSQGLATNFPTPTLIAEDKRFQGLTNGFAVNYKVPNDQWSAVTNTNLVILAKAYAVHGAQVARLASRRRSSTLVKVVLTLVVLVPPAFYVASILSRRIKSHNKQVKGLVR